MKKLGLKKADLAEGNCTEATTEDGISLAVCNIGGEFYALPAVCPHMGGPLGEGSLEGDVLTCPWHGWSFNVKLGECLTNPAAPIEKYKISVQGDDLFLGD